MGSWCGSQTAASNTCLKASMNSGAEAGRFITQCSLCPLSAPPHIVLSLRAHIVLSLRALPALPLAARTAHLATWNGMHGRTRIDGQARAASLEHPLHKCTRTQVVGLHELVHLRIALTSAVVNAREHRRLWRSASLRGLSGAEGSWQSSVAARQAPAQATLLRPLPELLPRLPSSLAYLVELCVLDQVVMAARVEVVGVHLTAVQLGCGHGEGPDTSHQVPYHIACLEAGNQPAVLPLQP